MSDSLRPHGLQHTKLPWPSPSSRGCINSCSSSWWCHPTISSSVISFSYCLQSFPASGSFPVSQLFIRWPKYWSFSFSNSLSNEYSGLISFRIDWLVLLAVQGTLKSLLHHHISKVSHMWQLIHASESLGLPKWFVSQSTTSDSTVQKSPAPRNPEVALVFHTELCLLSPKFWGCNSDPGLAVLTL